MPQDAQRKAWNEAMLSAGGISNLPKSLQKQTRRSDRQKRRDKARISTIKQISSGADDEGYSAAVWLDALEEVDPTQDDDADAEQQEEYNELEELQQKSNIRTIRKKRRATKVKAGQVPKRFKSKSLASILLEETQRDNGVAHLFVEAAGATSYVPVRRYCPVTGLPGLYREPKSGVSYATNQALEQIRERPPPWMTLTGAAAYNDLVKSFQQDREKRQVFDEV